MCRVAQEDFPEGSRCSFIQLSNRVEQRKGYWKSRERRVEGEKKKTYKGVATQNEGEDAGAVEN